MLTVRVIPCLDVRNGRVVKGVKFGQLRDAGSPAELAALYEEQGADELVMLDISATPEGRETQTDTIQAIRSGIALPLTVGGGVRTQADAGRLLGAGADKVAINTAAVTNPSLLEAIAQKFGTQCTVIAIDAALCEGNEADWEVVVRSGKERTGLDAVAWAERAEAMGVGEILLTSWDRDGTRSGYDQDLIRAISMAVHIPVIASGGAAHAEHMVEALQAGADAVLAASVFHDGEYTVGEIKQALSNAGLQVRR
ncbi:MAG: imidazole glycerol phosphate synthase subunit HisF [Myxococcales bacterium]|nr:imidazole glycerol phosphate synthase subunit HisF [Myxococcales bacterium]MCB9708957.1 imidazole glycerol phosphate synthase subunit HisF [Myxococcales bacterium]